MKFMTSAVYTIIRIVGKKKLTRPGEKCRAATDERENEQTTRNIIYVYNMHS